jgi:hypothetical protein
VIAENRIADPDGWSDYVEGIKNPHSSTMYGQAMFRPNVKNYLPPKLGIREILVRIRIPGTCDWRIWIWIREAQKHTDLDLQNYSSNFLNLNRDFFRVPVQYTSDRTVIFALSKTV